MRNLSGLLLVACVALFGCPSSSKNDASVVTDGGSATSGSEAHAGSGTTAGSGTAGTTHGSSDGGGDVAADGGKTRSSDAATGEVGDGGSKADPGCDADCEPHQVCKLVQVQCIRAPCPAQPTCMDDPCAVVRCKAGTTCVATSDGAECQPNDDAVPCGKNTCTGGQVCCNASCGTCVAPDMSCIQIACE